MKKLYLFFAFLLSMFVGNSAMALDLPSGVMSRGDAEKTLTTGKWYFLFNQGTSKYIQENANNALKQVGTPTGKDVASNAGYLVTLEDAGDGKYYIKTGLGNYYKGPGSSARGTGADVQASWAMAINPINGTEGHFILQGSTYTMVAPADGSDIKGGTNKTAGSIGDWVFYNVKVGSAEDLTGRDLYNYQMGKMGLIRLHNKRTATAYLTTNEAGSAVCAPRDTTSLSQVWILEKSGEGHTLRSANTGQYLQDSYAEPAASAKVLYIQFSPNNKDADAYINISSNSDFSGSTCMNLKTDGTTVTKWSYSGDAGSDWAIELVDDVTEEEVRENLNQQKGYVSELIDGAYYRLISTQYGVYATETDNDVKGFALNATNYSQYWLLTKNGNGYSFQNVLTQNYIQPQNNRSNIYRTATPKATLYPTRTNDKWEYKWTIPNAQGGTTGMHTDQSKNVVMWNTDADASVWAFQKVELSQEDIEAARAVRAIYEGLVNNAANIQTSLDKLFADKACTTLNPEIQALTDEQLAANADYQSLYKDLQEMVLKVKNNTWKQFTNNNTGYTADFERFFRIADYKIYSHHQQMCNGSNFTMSNSFGKLSGPTGIVAQPNDIIFIFVDEAPKDECTLQLEAVSTNGVPGNNTTGTVINLKKGLNIYSPNQQMMLYIFHQLNNTQKYLADYPDIKIHIEGGDLHGYWDATRGMTNADWKLLQQDLLKEDVCKNVNLKTEHLVFAMDNKLVKQCEPTNMEGLMRIWETIPVNEERYMGVEDFEGRYRNIWNVFSINYNYMFATTYGTYYNESTLPSIMSYDAMRKAGSLWGPSHEMGHNHQASINVIGTTESSNNMFSNINTFEQGIQTTRRMLPNDSFNELAKGTPWLGRDIWNTTSMFFQLYLYFHAMHHDDNFLPNLFRTMRKNPINKWSGPGTPSSYGKDDYLHLAKKICDVAQADLSEFFESYGMFVPVDKYEVGDYSNYTVTTTQADIDAAKKYMQKYPKKLGNLMFIDDHITPMKDANPDNIFEAIPATNGKKTNNTSQHNSDLPVGDAGDYENYDGHTEYAIDGDYYAISSGEITFYGKNYMGHKFYDKKGNLIWATNSKKIKLPATIKALTPDQDYTVVAAEANFEDVPCPYYKSKESKVYKSMMYFGKEEGNKTWWANANTNWADYMPVNTIGVVGSKDAPENITNTPNIINMDSTAVSIVLDGDKPAYIPQEATVQSVSFTKTNEGYAALNLPFEVTNAILPELKTASYDGNTLSITSASHVAAGQPVVVQGNVSITASNVMIQKGSFQQTENAKILASDGQSIITADIATPFTYIIGDGTGIISVAGNSQQPISNAIYDLSGRRIVKPTKAGLYIRNGKKVIMK